MKKQNLLMVILLIAMLALTLAPVLLAEVAEPAIEAATEVAETPPGIPTGPGWLDWVMSNLWGFILGGLAAFGVSLAFVWKLSREIGEFFVALANFGEGTGDWPTLKKEFLDILPLFKNPNPLDTEKGLFAAKVAVEKNGKKHR